MHCSSSSPTVSMATSSETTSHAGQTASSVMLNIKPNQNLTLDLNSSQYSRALKPMIECLQYSRLAQALTMAESVPLIHLSRAYLSAIYNPNEGVITFDIDSNKTSVSKTRLCRMLEFSSKEGLVDPELISSAAIIEMFFQMGYLGEIILLLKFNKPNLPPIWNGLFYFTLQEFF